MNRYFFRLLLPLFAAGIAASCIRIPKPSATDPNAAPLTYRFDGGADLTSLFTLEAAYLTDGGRLETEKIGALPWSRQVSIHKPFDARLEVRFRKKDAFPAKTEYAVGFAGAVDVGDAAAPAVAAALPVTTRAAADNLVRLRFTLPEGISADQVSLRFAPLKYDKHFAFTFTCDDSYVNAYSRIWSLINAKWIDEREFNHPGALPTTGYRPGHPLTMGDGCGNERRFGFSCAIWPSWGNKNNVTFIKDLAATGVNSMYISWEELALLSDFGVSMLYHNVDERVYGKDDPAQIAKGLLDDYDKVYRKLGLKMKVLGLPDGNEAYAQAARQSDVVAFMRNVHASATRIRLHRCGDLAKGETYGGDNNSIIERKLDELAAQAASDDPYWVGITVHRCGEDYMRMLEQIYTLYGKGGSDRLWVASWDEIYEYVAMREGCVIRKSAEGRTVTFELELPDVSDFLFRDVSLLVDGVGECEVEPLTDNVVGLTHAPREGGMLVNVNFNPRLPVLAEKYTAVYEQSFTDDARTDAEYFVSQLTPALAAPLRQRLGAVVSPSEARIAAPAAEAYRRQLDGYTFVVGRSIAGDK